MSGVTVGVSLGFLDDVIRPWAPTPRGNFSFLTKKLASAFLET